ncbi:MAG: tRNA (N6-isopentenyl adenosine(37)-C2)-methylthiotransferase MiaB, partial [Clostridia bacterium]|nr:tRNA (N6-isopentenyl adenosine(37)-C2)-methylthiotransferase MiaB [Clostridia bacterium]
MTIDFKEQEIIMQRVKTLLNGEEKFALVETYGCQQNVNDSQKYEGMLMKMGYT